MYGEHEQTALYHLSLHDALPIYDPKAPPVTPGRQNRWHRSPAHAQSWAGSVTISRASAATNTSKLSFSLSALRSVSSTEVSTSPDRKSKRLNSSHMKISYAVFCF